MLQKEIIVENTSKDFAEFLYEGIGTDELQIYIGLLLKFQPISSLWKLEIRSMIWNSALKFKKLVNHWKNLESARGFRNFQPKGCNFQIITKLPV